MIFLKRDEAFNPAINDFISRAVHIRAALVTALCLDAVF